NPYGSDKKRELPDNVIVWEPLVPTNRSLRILYGIFNFSPLGMYINDYFNERLYSSFTKTIRWTKSLLMFRRIYSKMKEFLKAMDYNTILYAYWADAPLMATKLCRSFTKVVRM